MITDLPPGAGHPLGTDQNGFDELGRIMVGGQTALEIGFLAAAIATVIGTLYGAIAGLVGGLLDGIMMRFVDILLSIPFLFVGADHRHQIQRHGDRRCRWSSGSSRGWCRRGWSAARC